MCLENAKFDPCVKVLHLPSLISFHNAIDGRKMRFRKLFPRTFFQATFQPVLLKYRLFILYTFFTWNLAQSLALKLP